MMPPLCKNGREEGRIGAPPAGFARVVPRLGPEWLDLLLHTKGFGGGVPINTETAAVNPRAGVE